jgi:hypothetical protein
VAELEEAEVVERERQPEQHHGEAEEEPAGRVSLA